MPTNPYKQARELLNLTQANVAYQAEVSPSAVMFNEQGLYVKPLPVLNTFFGEWFDVGSLEQMYYRFQSRTRQENRRMWLLPDVDLFREPIKSTISHNGLTPTRFCKNYCCQPILLRNPKRIAGHLQKVMLAAGFTPVQLDELRERLLEYADRQRTKSSKLHRTAVL